VSNAKCTVVNIRHADCDVYIGRPSAFGNPFRLGVNTRQRVIELYREAFNGWIASDPEFRERALALKGKTLGCYCKPEACHGDVIAEWVNAQS
jgi:hypothetical protein